MYGASDKIVATGRLLMSFKIFITYKFEFNSINPMPYSVLIEKNTYAVVSPVRLANWSRYSSIDLLRGVVMIIMALDHVRAYFHKDAFYYDPVNIDATTPAVFFTRWITHYCAPVFVFLAGLSAYLYGAGKTRKRLSRFLLSRGLWLVFAELVIVSLGWTFNPSYPVINLQVIWAIGFCMIAMSALIYFDLRALHIRNNCGRRKFISSITGGISTLLPMTAEMKHIESIFLKTHLLIRSQETGSSRVRLLILQISGQ